MTFSYRANVRWERGVDDASFTQGRYSRGHDLSFEDGPSVRGTASHHVVGKTWAESGAVDPEQLLVAAISACHMLTFLHVARDRGFVVDSYHDEAEGIMEEDAEGRLVVSRVWLRPVIAYAGTTPPEPVGRELHHRAHAACFIANSVRTEIVVDEPQAPRGTS